MISATTCPSCATVMAVDHDCSPEIAALIGTSAALAISDIPWNGPVGALKVGLVDGELVLNPTSEQRKVSDLDVTVVSTGKKVVMIEAGAERGRQRHDVPVPSSWRTTKIRSRSSSSTAWSPRSASPSSTILTRASIRSCSTRSLPTSWTRPRPPWIPTTRTSARPAGTR